MEGLQGFVAGTVVTFFIMSSVLLVMMSKAYRDGHIDGQKAMGAVEPEDPGWFDHRDEVRGGK